MPVSRARPRPWRRRPACTQMNASTAIAAAAGQCETEPNDRPIGFVDRWTDSSPTPMHKTAAPTTSQTRTALFGFPAGVASGGEAAYTPLARPGPAVHGSLAGS